jgi:hypothetical protein
VTINCTLTGGGGGTNPDPQLATLDIQSTNTPGLYSGMVTTAAPVSSDLTVSVSISTKNSDVNLIPGTYWLPLPSIVIPAGSTSASFPVVWISGDYLLPGKPVIGTSVSVLTASAGSSSVTHGVPQSIDDFSCQGSTGGVAADPLTISGTVLKTVLNASHILEPGSAPGVTVEAHPNSGGLVASTITDGSGNFSLSIPTGGIPFDGYLYMKGSNLLNAAAYWSKPLTSATTTAPFMLDSSQLLYALAGTSQQPGTSPIAVWVTDCKGTPIGDFLIATAPGVALPAQRIGFNFGGPNFWVLDAPNGGNTVYVVDHSRTFGQTTFTTVDGETTFVTITP